MERSDSINLQYSFFNLQFHSGSAELSPSFRNRFLIQEQPHGIYSGFSDP